MNPQENLITICACCQRPLPPGKIYFCPDTCWPAVPAKDRVQLYTMHTRKIDTTTKVEAIVRKLLKRKASKIPQAWTAGEPGPAQTPEPHGSP